MTESCGPSWWPGWSCLPRPFWQVQVPGHSEVTKQPGEWPGDLAALGRFVLTKEKPRKTMADVPTIQSPLNTDDVNCPASGLSCQP